MASQLSTVCECVCAFLLLLVAHVQMILCMRLASDVFISACLGKVTEWAIITLELFAGLAVYWRILSHPRESGGASACHSPMAHFLASCPPPPALPLPSTVNILLIYGFTASLRVYCFRAFFFVCLLSWLFVCLHYNRQPEDAARSAQAADVLISSFTPNVRHTHTLDVHMCVCR